MKKFLVALIVVMVLVVGSVLLYPPVPSEVLNDKHVITIDNGMTDVYFDSGIEHFMDEEIMSFVTVIRVDLVCKKDSSFNRQIFFSRDSMGSFVSDSSFIAADGKIFLKGLAKKNYEVEVKTLKKGLDI